MNEWLGFVTENGLTREYFDMEVKPPLSALMKIYQSRTLDKQSEVLDFIKDTDKGLARMVAENAFNDLFSGGYSKLDDFPPYKYLVRVMKGTATGTEVSGLLDSLTNYMGEYSDYEERFGVVPAVTETEFAVIKENLPKLAKALVPILIADAKYTQATYGENYSLYYTYSLISNAETLVIGHIPESIMPILKSLITEDEEEWVPGVPNTGREGANREDSGLVASADCFGTIIGLVLIGGAVWYRKKSKRN